MEQEDKWKLLKMIIRCNKSKSRKPKRVLEPQLKVGNLDSPLFADEVKEKSFGRITTNHLRHNLQSCGSNN